MVNPEVNRGNNDQTNMNMTGKDNIKRFSLPERIRSFRAAFNGVIVLFRYEHNARIHLSILIIVILAGILLDISGAEWLVILIVSGLVFISECFNSALEYLGDVVTGGQNENIRRAKDVAAAGVLISAIISVIAGLIIFIPAVARFIGE